MKYMIIEVIERQISQPLFFTSLEEAKAELKTMAKEVKDGIITYEGMCAYGETANHDNWDAEIFEIGI